MDSFTQQQSILPLLSLNAEPPDFDYGAFLQDDGVDNYLATDSPGSHSELDNAVDDGVAQGSAPSSSALAMLGPVNNNNNNRAESRAGSSSGTEQPKGRLERRGHTKSRRGCFNCKRRRIKCQENRPACGHCVKTGLQCEYPRGPQIVHQPAHQIPLFSLQDMRFFQHFLLECKPHQPLDCISVWTHEVPCLSQTHEYLMHAVLGLAASDLMRKDASLVTAAVAHRLKAIKAVKKALGELPKAPQATDSFSDRSNALLATCYALTFQSVLLEDGMAEYMTFVRGIFIVALNMYMKGAKFLFRNLAGEDQLALVGPIMERLPLLNRAWVDAAHQSIAALEPLYAGDETALEYHRHLMEIVRSLYVSSFEAYVGITKHYGWWMQLPHEKFRAVVDPESQVFLLLASHWVSVKQIMATITEIEVKVSKGEDGKRGGDMDAGILRWLGYINRQIRPEYAAFNRFPVWVETQLARDSTFFGRTL